MYVLYFSELKCNDEEIDDIVKQLNKTAEKLNRLDAVKDLKLLQVNLLLSIIASQNLCILTSC